MRVGWLLVLGFAVIQLAMYAIFRRWRGGVEKSLQESIDRLSNHSRDGDEVVAILRFPNNRKKVIWVLVVVFLGIFASCVLFVAASWPYGGGAWPEFVMGFVVIDIGSAVPWLAFLNPYGNIRVVTLKGLIWRSPWFLGTRFVRWDQIHWVKWVPLGNAFMLNTEKGIFLVYSFLENIEVFANAVMTNLPNQKWKKAAGMLNKALTGPFQPTL